MLRGCEQEETRMDEQGGGPLPNPNPNPETGHHHLFWIRYSCNLHSLMLSPRSRKADGEMSRTYETWSRPRRRCSLQLRTGSGSRSCSPRCSSRPRRPRFLPPGHSRFAVLCALATLLFILASLSPHHICPSSFDVDCRGCTGKLWLTLHSPPPFDHHLQRAVPGTTRKDPTGPVLASIIKANLQLTSEQHPEPFNEQALSSFASPSRLPCTPNVQCPPITHSKVEAGAGFQELFCLPRTGTGPNSPSTAPRNRMPDATSSAPLAPGM
eukprot:377242-Rhodomonas_salina.1